ncbi:MAG: hypothetical protein PHO02_05720 [Candidatus Nanoarchaeia archaeon]|nr:hypothetical protein [Candidatus Nanoarchaeia archaeon]
MSILGRKNFGKVLEGIGEVGVVIGGGLVLYSLLNMNDSAQARYNQVMQLSERVSECNAETQVCSELREKYKMLVAQDDTPRLMADYADFKNDHDIYLSIFLGGMVLSLIGEKRIERGKRIELEKKLAEKQ